MNPEFSSADCMEALQLAGRIIMENGGEISRAEETVLRMGKGFGLDKVESFAVPSGLFISFRSGDGNPTTSIKRVRRVDRNLTRVDEVNQVSRKVFSGEMDCAGAIDRLREIESIPGAFSGWWGLPAAFLCAAGFAALFGGSLLTLVFAGLVAVAVQAVEMMISRVSRHGLAGSVIGGFITALLPHLLHLALPSLQPELLIISAIMPLVPGLSMTNAVQDAMRGDMVSGLSHGAQAILTAFLIAGGALLALAVMKLITGGGF